MVVIKGVGPQLRAVLSMLTMLGRNKTLDVMTVVRLNSTVRKIKDVLIVWEERLDPLIRRYTEQPEEEMATIATDHPRWKEFDEDPDVKEHLAQVLEVQVNPIKLTELLAAERRADRKDVLFTLDGEHLDKLMELGVIVDDVSEPEPDITPTKKRKSSRKK